MKSRMMIGLLVIAIAAAVIGGATMAWFWDTDDAGEAVFTAGTLRIGVTEGLTEFHDLGVAGNMNPGDVYDEIVIEITNEGTKNLAWFGNWIFTPEIVGDDKLLDAIYIKTMGSQFLDADGDPWIDSPESGWEWYKGYNFIEDGRGNDVGHNAGEAAVFDAIADMSAKGVITLRNWNDNNHMITLPGAVWEQMGALRPGENKYVFNIEFGFHSSAGNEYQGDAVGVSPITVAFEVTATQVNEDAINDAIMAGLGTAHIAWLEAQIAVQP